MGGEIHKIISWSFWTANLVSYASLQASHPSSFSSQETEAAIASHAATASELLIAQTSLTLPSMCFAARGRCVCNHGLGYGNKPGQRIWEPAHSHLEGCPIHSQILCQQQHMASSYSSMRTWWPDGGAVQSHELYCPTQVC